MTEPMLIAQHGQAQCFLQPDKANCHGLITGTTGIGKTIILQTMAEGFAKLGVPVFMANIKCDLTGLRTSAGGAQAAIELKIFELEPVQCTIFHDNCHAKSATSKPNEVRHARLRGHDDLIPVPIKKKPI